MLRINFDRPTLTYKDFTLKAIDDFSYPFGTVTCAVQKDGYEERVRDEHGRLTLFYHKPEKFSFMIDPTEFIVEDDNPETVIYNRFVAEVDYYIKQHSPVRAEDVFPNFYIRRYTCPCCGTDYTTDKEGYTPTCKNCGALMEPKELKE